MQILPTATTANAWALINENLSPLTTQVMKQLYINEKNTGTVNTVYTKMNPAVKNFDVLWVQVT